MQKELITEILDRLMTGDLTEYYVTNDNFMEFREVLVKRKDFKHFRGIGQRGGDVLYHYLKEPRS